MYTSHKRSVYYFKGYFALITRQVSDKMMKMIMHLTRDAGSGGAEGAAAPPPGEGL